jgi:hypothetical protein
MSESRRMLDENVVLPLWPEVGRLLHLGRGATYAAAERGEIEIVEIGKLKRVPTAWLKRKLGISERNSHRETRRFGAAGSKCLGLIQAASF